MRLEATGNLKLFIETLDLLDYPHPWPDEFLAASITAFAKTDEGNIVGAAFYHWGPVFGHIYCHLATLPGTIITRNVIGDFHKIPELMGGTELRVALQAVPDDIIEFAKRSGWKKSFSDDVWSIPLNPCPWTQYGRAPGERKEAA